MATKTTTSRKAQFIHAVVLERIVLDKLAQESTRAVILALDRVGNWYVTIRTKENLDTDANVVTLASLTEDMKKKEPA